MTKYRCSFVGDCDRATAGEIFEREPGADLKCPGCENQLALVASDEPRAGGTKTAPVVLAACAVVVVVAGGAAWSLMGSGKAAAAASTSQPSAAAPQAASQSVSAGVVKTAVAPAAISPSDKTTESLKADSQAGLGAGEAAKAADASTKAASNELVKRGIAHLAQSKLDEAEKSFTQALDIDPKQSLSYYNLAILRLRQGRQEDALKFFESSFLNGFAYFDKMDADPDLETIRKDTRFVALRAKYQPK